MGGYKVLNVDDGVRVLLHGPHPYLLPSLLSSLHHHWP